MTRPTLFLPVFIVLCGLAVTGALAVHHTGILIDQGLHSHGVPHVGNNDGYYHLNQARLLAESGAPVSGFLADSRQSMLLPYLLSGIADDSATLHLVSAYLGPLLGLSMLFAVLPWAMDTGSRFTVVAAPLLALVAPYWITRTHVGFLDTDALVPWACMFALFCLYRFATGVARRGMWAAGYSVAVMFLWFWWRPGLFICAGYLLCYLAYPALTRTDRLLKAVLAAAGAVAVGLGVAGVEPLAELLGYGMEHAKLAFGGVEGSLLSSAIMELQGVGLIGLGEKGLGTVWLLPVAAVGTVAYGIRYRWKSVFLIAGWLFGLGGLFSQRFIPLFIPVGAFFAAYGMAACCEWAASVIPGNAGGKALRRSLLVACVPLLLWGAVSKAVQAKPRSYFTPGDFTLAETVRTSFPQGTVIWTWWDFGYFFRYLTGMKTYFDGGSQTERTCFVAAYPLMQDDCAAAGAWIHHFSGTGPKGFSLAARGEKWGEYLAGFTRKVVASRSGHGSVALVLPARVYTTTGYLYAFAHVFDAEPPPVANHLDLFSGEGFSYTPSSGTVMVPQAMLDKGYDGFGGVIDAAKIDPGAKDFTTIPDPYLVYSDFADFLAVTDRAMVRSVLFRLLGLFPSDTHHFEPVAFDYRYGGVWRVR